MLTCAFIAVTLGISPAAAQVAAITAAVGSDVSIDVTEIEFGALIGDGSFGSVFRVIIKCSHSHLCHRAFSLPVLLNSDRLTDRRTDDSLTLTPFTYWHF